MTRVRKRPGVARGPLRTIAIEDQLHLVGAAEVEVLADDLLEEDAARDWPVQNLGQRELRLQDRQVVADSPRRGPRRVKGCGSRRSHLRSSASIFSADSPSQIACSAAGSAQERRPLSSASKAMPSLRELALEVLVAVEAQLGVVGEVRAELQEERPEVAVDGVEVVPRSQPVDATDRQNTSDGFIQPKRLSRAVVEFPRDRVELGSSVDAEIGVPGEVLAEQAVAVLVAAALPGAVRIAEEDADVGVDGELHVLGHLLALVPGERAAQFRGETGELASERNAHVLGGAAVGQVQRTT